MSVWFVVPSKRPFSECDPTLELWRKQGYRVGLWRDAGDVAGFLGSEVLIERKYEGYSIAVNELVKYVLSADPAAEWIVTGGDDIQPDPNKSATVIALQLRIHFYEAMRSSYPPHRPLWAQRLWCPDIQSEGFAFNADAANWALFGVMQPTGDRWGDTAHARAMFGEERGASIDRICGSPWMGREFCKRAYGGRGPMWPEYFHMFNDEELQEVAIKLGCFWQRRDLVHLHQHWGRGPESNPNAPASLANQPEFLKYAAGPENWKKMKEIFLRRKAAGFPGHEPL